MPGLILSLSPGERFLINGAVIENGLKKTRLNIRTPHVHILRLRDAVHPEDVSTPVTRACYLLQLILCDDLSLDDGWGDLDEAMASIASVFHCPSVHDLISECRTALRDGNVYWTLRKLRELANLERNLLR